MITLSVELRNFSAFYGYKRILTNLNLKINSGSCTGLIGPNGAGKSTLMKGILGLISTSGELYFNDQLIQNNGIMDHFQEFRKKVGYMPEFSSSYKFLSPREFLTLIGNLQKFERTKTDHHVDVVLKYFNLNLIQDRMINELSKGNIQRLSLATTFMQSPSVLFLDEPLNGLSIDGRKSLLNIIREYTTTGLAELGMDGPGTVLISSHLLRDLGEICDNFILLNSTGTIAWIGSKTDLDDQDDIVDIEQLYLQVIRE